jgi:hypothetical protein
MAVSPSSVILCAFPCSSNNYCNRFFLTKLSSQRARIDKLYNLGILAFSIAFCFNSSVANNSTLPQFGQTNTYIGIIFSPSSAHSPKNSLAPPLVPPTLNSAV